MLKLIIELFIHKELFKTLDNDNWISHFFSFFFSNLSRAIKKQKKENQEEVNKQIPCFYLLTAFIIFQCFVHIFWNIFQTNIVEITLSNTVIKFIYYTFDYYKYSIIKLLLYYSRNFSPIWKQNIWLLSFCLNRYTPNIAMNFLFLFSIYVLLSVWCWFQVSFLPSFWLIYY